MNIKDDLRLAKGIVRPSFVNLSTGKKIDFSKRNNKLSYMAAEAVAAAFGGDPSYIPCKIGFIYGDSETMPTESVITRNQTWEGLLEELSSNNDISTVDVQVVGFSYAPTLGGENPVPSSGSDSSQDDDESDYTNILPNGSNAITFHAVSNSQDRGVMFDSDTFHSGSYVYQCVLLGYHVDGSGHGKYYVIARASLKDFSSGSGDGRYLQKPDGFEVALDWTVVFH